MTERLPLHFSLSCIGEGNGNPLQCFCLENPRDGEAWWAVFSGVAQSQTRLKRLSSSSRATSEAHDNIIQNLFLLPPHTHTDICPHSQSFFYAQATLLALSSTSLTLPPPLARTSFSFSLGRLPWASTHYGYYYGCH